MYERLSAFAQTGGLVIFMIVFGLVLTYALRPGARDEFAAAARQPLSDDDKPARAGSEDAS